MKILSSFTHPHVVPNLYEFLYSVKHKIYFEECWYEYIVWGGENTMEVNGFLQTHKGLEQLEGE